MDYTMKERMTQTTVSYGFAIPGLFEFGYNHNKAKYTKSIQKIRRASGNVSCSIFFVFFPFLSWKASGASTFSEQHKLKSNENLVPSLAFCSHKSFQINENLHASLTSFTRLPLLFSSD